MEIVNARSALLSNFEVLGLLRELESDHLARTKTAVRIKKEEEAAGGISTIVPGGRHPSFVEISENLRTVEVEAIQYLSADYQPTSSQTSEGIGHLVQELGKYDLTKAEKLQIVNLAPTLPVELYVVVEELEDRLGESMEDILGLVKASLISKTVSDDPAGGTMEFSEQTVAQKSWDPEDGIDEMEFDDTGEGAGVEGDLDMEDD
ncbi:RNA polymerase Rpb4-domain-containing protein [Mycena floridula]|nr:RNA polymerase Rpb4-domain-containing protein [Mycena floridula]